MILQKQRPMAMIFYDEKRFCDPDLIAQSPGSDDEIEKNQNCFRLKYDVLKNWF